MISGLLYVLVFVAFLSLILGVLWNVKLWGLTFITLAFLLFGFISISAPQTFTEGLNFFDNGLIWLSVGMLLISGIMWWAKLAQETQGAIS